MKTYFSINLTEKLFLCVSLLISTFRNMYHRYQILDSSSNKSVVKNLLNKNKSSTFHYWHD